MTLDDAIRHCEEVTDRLRSGCDEVAKGCEADHRQLAEWLRELKERRLSAQLEQTDCEFCHEDSDGYVSPIEKNSHAVIYGSVLHLKAMGWSGKVQIKYCPICGRRLIDD